MLVNSPLIRIRWDVDDQKWQSASDIEKAETEPLLTLKKRTGVDLELLTSSLQRSCAVLLVLSVVNVCMTLLSVVSMCMTEYTKITIFASSMSATAANMIFLAAYLLKDVFAFLAAASILFCSAPGIRGVSRSARYAKVFATVAAVLYSFFLLVLLLGLVALLSLLLIAPMDVAARISSSKEDLLLCLLYLLYLVLHLVYAVQVAYRSAHLVSAAAGVGISSKASSYHSV